MRDLLLRVVLAAYRPRLHRHVKRFDVMTKTSSRAALLHIAVQDLHAGKRAQAERLPGVRDAADPELAALLDAEIARATAQADRLASAGGDMAGPGCLWMRSVLDDAERDARSHQPGPVLDVALVGAVRKATAAEIVSGETALALARREGLAAIEAAVAANRDEERATDRALRALLERLTAG